MGKSPGWLKKSFVKSGKKLVRRQDLPQEALLTATAAVTKMDLQKDGMPQVGVISHGWLRAGHPDPAGDRRSDVEKISMHAIFWDFLSLHQVQRSAHEERSFGIALASMHNVYGNKNWY